VRTKEKAHILEKLSRSLWEIVHVLAKISCVGGLPQSLEAMSDLVKLAGMRMGKGAGAHRSIAKGDVTELCGEESETSSQDKRFMVQWQDGRQAVTLFGVDDAVSVDSKGIELAFRARQQVIL
jgi:hypothetical protein